jgi:hypothetical protein
MSTGSDAGGGIGFSSALALLFIGLKLGGVITWPWLWVLCPLWIPFIVVIAFLILFLLAKAVFGG